MHVQAVEDIKRLVRQRDIKGAGEITDRFSLLFSSDAKEPAYMVRPTGPSLLAQCAWKSSIIRGV